MRVEAKKTWVMTALGLVFTAALAMPAYAADLGGRVVVQPDGQPAKGVWVKIERVSEILQGFPDGSYNPKKATRSAYTDSRGNFVLNKLPTGVYEVSVEGDSLPLWLTTVGEPRRTVLVSSRDHARVQLTVSTLATLSGQVRREEGGAVRGGRVLIFQKGADTPFALVRLDQRGRYQVPELERGVQIAVQVITEEGLFRRVETTPLHAGFHRLDVEVPSWSKIKKQQVVAQIMVPRAGDALLELEWTSTPRDGAGGYSGRLKLDPEGKVKFESPPGVYEVRVHEIAKEPRTWIGNRYYRVDLEADPPQVFNIKVRESNIPSGSTSPLSARN